MTKPTQFNRQAGSEPRSRDASANQAPPRPSASRDDTRPGAAVASLLGAIARAEELIDIETAGLENNTPIDLQDIGRRKTHSLLELTRLARALPPGTDGQAIAGQLGTFRAKLQRNAELLKLHLAATGEIASVIASALRDADWDGTYDRMAQRSGPAR